MSVKSKKIKYRRHAAPTEKFAQRRPVHTDPNWTGVLRSVTPCPDQKKGKRSDEQDAIEEHTANQKEYAVEETGRNRAVYPRILLYTNHQVRQSPMPVCKGRTA